jgi:hypothetical protein
MKLLFPFIIIGFSVLQSCSNSNASSTKEAVAIDSIGVETSSPKTTDSIQVPGIVLTSFMSLFPKATHVEWEMEENNYEASFQLAGVKKSVVFTPEGEDVSSETEINVNSLPETMTNYIASNLNGKKIDEAVMGLTASGGITYEIEVEGKDYIFDGSGNFLKTEETEVSEDD